VFEAADFQWWWRKPRPTDALPQLFWFDEAGRPEAAVIATDWGDTIGLDPIVMPDASPDLLAEVVAHGLAHAYESGFDAVDIAIDRAAEVMVDVLAGHGFTSMEDEAVDAWLAADARPAISSLHPDYRRASRLDTRPAPHHMIPRGGPDIEERLRQTSLYRPDLDLVVLDGDDRAAAYGLFWFDPVTATGLVEPMRTEEDHQRRGLARHVLTTGINLLADAGADRIKIAFRQDNPAASTLYTSVGFTSVRPCAVVSRKSW
jgi:GNAT superfamily N-acetyltransferase